MTASVNDFSKMMLMGQNTAVPKMWRNLSASISPMTTTWTRLDFATLVFNEFPAVTAGGLKLVDWDTTNKLITFNDQAGSDHNYEVFFTTEVTATGISLPPILPPVSVQLRYVIPDAGGVGVHFYYPNHGAASGKEYMDFSDIIANNTVVHHQGEHFSAVSLVRAHGIGIDVRLSTSMPILSAANLDGAMMYIVAD